MLRFNELLWFYTMLLLVYSLANFPRVQKNGLFKLAFPKEVVHICFIYLVKILLKISFYNGISGIKSSKMDNSIVFSNQNNLSYYQLSYY